MTIRRWFFLFWTTLLIGAVTSVGVGMYLLATDPDFSIPGFADAGVNFGVLLLSGAMISVVSQMGLFAFMILRFIGMGFVRKKMWWDLVQIFLIILVFFETVYLRHLNFSAEGEAFTRYMLLPVVMLAISLAAGYWKTVLTNAHAFIPTVFFVFVGTLLEAVPGLKMNNPAATLFMVAPLLVCNLWQILILHRLVKK